MSITEYAMLISAITLTANVAFTDLSFLPHVGQRANVSNEIPLSFLRIRCSELQYWHTTVSAFGL